MLYHDICCGSTHTLINEHFLHESYWVSPLLAIVEFAISGRIPMRPDGQRDEGEAM